MEIEHFSANYTSKTRRTQKNFSRLKSKNLGLHYAIFPAKTKHMRLCVQLGSFCIPDLCPNPSPAKEDRHTFFSVTIFNVLVQILLVSSAFRASCNDKAAWSMVLFNFNDCYGCMPLLYCEICSCSSLLLLKILLNFCLFTYNLLKRVVFKLHLNK